MTLGPPLWVSTFGFWGKRIATGSVAARLGGALSSSVRLCVVGTPHALASSAAPAEARLIGHVSGRGGARLAPSLPIRVGDAGREFVPCGTCQKRAAQSIPSSPNGAATSPLGGMRSTCLGWGFDLQRSAMSLSRPRPSRGGVLGAIEASERVADAHGLLRPHSRVSRRGCKDSR